MQFCCSPHRRAVPTLSSPVLWGGKYPPSLSKLERTSYRHYSIAYRSTTAAPIWRTAGSKPLTGTRTSWRVNGLWLRRWLRHSAFPCTPSLPLAVPPWVSSHSTSPHYDIFHDTLSSRGALIFHDIALDVPSSVHGHISLDTLSDS